MQEIKSNKIVCKGVSFSAPGKDMTNANQYVIGPTYIELKYKCNQDINCFKNIGEEIDYVRINNNEYEGVWSRNCIVNDIFGKEEKK